MHKDAYIMPYLNAQARVLGAKLPMLPKDIKTWEARRQVVRAELAKALGLPEREPMKAQITNTYEKDGLIWEDVDFLWADHTFVSGRVMRPKDVKGKLPTIVSPPGWLYGLGSGVDFCEHMAKQGYLVMIVDDPRVNKRQNAFAGQYGVAASAGTQAMGIQVFDNLRALDYVLTRDDVDQGRIGVCGLCQGSEQTWLAAALDDRFQMAIPVCGTTTYETWACMPFEQEVSLSDPSPWVWGILQHTDWHEIAACIAPRPVLIVSNSGDGWWPLEGYNKVTDTLEVVFGMYGVPDKFQHIRRLECHDFMPFIKEIDAWFDKYLKGLPPSHAAPLPCGKVDKQNFSMIQHFAEQMAKNAKPLPTTLDKWNMERDKALGWLRENYVFMGDKLGDTVGLYLQAEESLCCEIVAIPMNEKLKCMLQVRYLKANTGKKMPTVIVSGESNRSVSWTCECVSKELAMQGYLVATPEHMHGCERLVDLYGVGDSVDIPPLAIRLWDDMATVEYLLGRSDVDAKCLTIVGTGIGAVDACMTAALDERVAAAACLGGATTMQDWAAHSAEFFHHD
ncbi:MAG: dienelactone hydrolase family protein, partial [bacterium]